MDTIFALSTPAGKSGIAVIRVSGAAAKATLAAFGIPLPAPRVATLATLHLPLDGGGRHAEARSAEADGWGWRYPSP